MKSSHDDIVSLALDLSRHLRRRLLACGKDGTSFMRSHALAIIKESDNPTMKDFATSMKISASSATAFIDRLTKEGWVKRVPDPKNRKIIHLKITPKGNRIIAQSMQDKRAFLRDILTLLSTDDRKHLEHILQSLQSALAQNPSHS
ncbi:MAG TPA: MarR family transcriptional regulator [Candidatus Peribacteraceae bacterium]|nr:MarR family transcriptional regulator [Candidatus Peribacteraceae bacterium]